MDERLLKLYRDHASSEEAIAILFVKKNLNQAKGCWVDIIDYQRYEMSADDFHFRYVRGGLYRRKIQPQDPPKSEYTNNGKFDERQYYLMIRAITWETAQRDIKIQKSKKVKAK